VAATWSPKGQPPELNQTCSYAHLSLLGAITPTGSLYLTGQDVAFTGEDIVEFLTYLCHRYRRYNLLIIWDGATIHRSQAVKEFLTAHPGRVHLERLPGYSPELNAAEMLWNQLKKSLKNQAFLTLSDLEVVLKTQLEQLHQNPKLIRAFFRKKEVVFFTD